MYSSNAFYRSEAADCFSFAGVSAAKEKFLFLCVLGVSSEAPQGRDKRAVIILDSVGYRNKSQISY
jgi:hypothetical protein